jgi:hypothetical protein
MTCLRDISIFALFLKITTASIDQGIFYETLRELAAISAPETELKLIDKWYYMKRHFDKTESAIKALSNMAAHLKRDLTSLQNIGESGESYREQTIEILKIATHKCKLSDKLNEFSSALHLSLNTEDLLISTPKDYYSFTATAQLLFILGEMFELVSLLFDKCNYPYSYSIKNVLSAYSNSLDTSSNFSPGVSLIIQDINKSFTLNQVVFRALQADSPIDIILHKDAASPPLTEHSTTLNGLQIKVLKQIIPAANETVFKKNENLCDPNGHYTGSANYINGIRHRPFKSPKLNSVICIGEDVYYNPYSSIKISKSSEQAGMHTNRGVCLPLQTGRYKDYCGKEIYDCHEMIDKYLDTWKFQDITLLPGSACKPVRISTHFRFILDREMTRDGQGLMSVLSIEFELEVVKDDWDGSCIDIFGFHPKYTVYICQGENQEYSIHVKLVNVEDMEVLEVERFVLTGKERFRLNIDQKFVTVLVINEKKEGYDESLVFLGRVSNDLINQGYFHISHHSSHHEYTLTVIRVYEGYQWDQTRSLTSTAVNQLESNLIQDNIEEQISNTTIEIETGSAAKKVVLASAESEIGNSNNPQPPQSSNSSTKPNEFSNNLWTAAVIVTVFCLLLMIGMIFLTRKIIERRKSQEPLCTPKSSESAVTERSVNPLLDEETVKQNALTDWYSMLLAVNKK